MCHFSPLSCWLVVILCYIFHSCWFFSSFACSKLWTVKFHDLTRNTVNFSVRRCRVLYTNCWRKKHFFFKCYYLCVVCMCLFLFLYNWSSKKKSLVSFCCIFPLPTKWLTAMFTWEHESWFKIPCKCNKWQ